MFLRLPNFPRRRRDVPASGYAHAKLTGTDIPFPALRRGWLHARQLRAAWDVEKIVRHVGADAWLSHYGADDSDEHDTDSMRLICFAGFWPSHGFIELYLRGSNPLDDHPQGVLVVYAATARRAEKLFDLLLRHYRQPPAEQLPSHRIGLLNEAFGSLEVRRVPIADEQVVSREQVGLYYGDAMPDWIDHWMARLGERRQGLTVLSGPPGTGKTSLLRSMAHWMNASHQFYVMSAARFVKLDAGEIVSFWADENRTSKLRKVLVLEDAESVLLRRGADNRENVALLLNLTDGMTGDALGVQVVATMNGELLDLDPALLRPGRLIAQRELGPLSVKEARRLARHLKQDPARITAPATLAEITHPPAAEHPLMNALRPARRRFAGFDTNLTH